MLVLVASAFAQTLDISSLPEAPDAAPAVGYPTVTRVDFTELKVGGEAVGPSVPLVSHWKLPEHGPLIPLRTDFNDELSASVGEAR